MEKVPIEKQIEAVANCCEEFANDPHLEAALLTLTFLSRHPELIKVLYQLEKHFPKVIMTVTEKEK